MGFTAEMVQNIIFSTSNDAILVLENLKNPVFFNNIQEPLRSSASAVMIELAFGVDDFKHRLHRESFDLAVIHPAAEDMGELPALIERITSNLDPRQFFPILILLHPEDFELYEPQIPLFFQLGIHGILRSNQAVDEQVNTIKKCLYTKGRHNLAAELQLQVQDQADCLQQILNEQKPDYKQLSGVYGISIHGFLHHAKNYAGDLFKVFTLSENELLVVLIDAQESADRAIATNFYVLGLLEAEVAQSAEGVRLDQILTHLNAIYTTSHQGKSLCMLSLYHINTQTKKVQFAGAGQANGWMLNSTTHSIAQLETHSSGPPMGVEADLVYATAEVQLGAGEELILMTNGVWDQKLKDSSILNLKGICQLLSSADYTTPEERIESIKKHLVDVLNGNDLKDDAGLMIIAAP
ncbi:MAG: PP2C family protein-serine/threonine phosphatase [Sumerlaeia bacterium]